MKRCHVHSTVRVSPHRLHLRGRTSGHHFRAGYTPFHAVVASMRAYRHPGARTSAQERPEDLAFDAADADADAVDRQFDVDGPSCGEAIMTKRTTGWSPQSARCRSLARPQTGLDVKMEAPPAVLSFFLAGGDSILAAAAGGQRRAPASGPRFFYTLLPRALCTHGRA